MIILDTCALIFDALTPEKLTAAAKKAITRAMEKNQLFCCDISLWEIAMLIQKKRIDPSTDTKNFLELVLQARQIQTLPITVEIAELAAARSEYRHYDPADRLIAASTINHHADLITSDKKLRDIPGLSIIW